MELEQLAFRVTYLLGLGAAHLDVVGVVLLLLVAVTAVEGREEGLDGGEVEAQGRPNEHVDDLGLGGLVVGVVPEARIADEAAAYVQTHLIEHRLASIVVGDPIGLEDVGPGLRDALQLVLDADDPDHSKQLTIRKLTVSAVDDGVLVEGVANLESLK